MKKVYNKLVRDKIPAIIKQDGKTCTTEKLSGESFLIELRRKLQEEVDEFLTSGEVEELADIMEVIKALAELSNCSYAALEELRTLKANKRGGFSERIYLKEVIENDD